MKINIKRSFLALGLTFISQYAAAFPSHTGFCRYGEECGGIVSTNIYEAQRICSRDPFDTISKAVYQQQRNGSIVFVGYVCVSPRDGG
jgi:hypothetical protein